MFCNRCGSALEPERTACPACGQPVATGIASPLVPAVPRERERLARHLRVLAVCWFVVAFLCLIPSGALFAIGTVAGLALSPAGPGAWLARTLGPLVLYGLGGIAFVIAALCFAAGWGLLKIRPWARGLAIVLGAISLLHPPFGTALGIYTLWVLLSGDSGAEYDRMAASGT